MKKLGFKNKEEFIEESIRTFLAARKDLRISLAANMYKDEKISLGKAMEISRLNIEEMKEELHRRGIERKTTDMEKSSERALKYTRR